MPHGPKLPFDALPGLPSGSDQEVAALMEAIGRMPREGSDELSRCLLRAALGYERTGDAWYLICLAEDALFTARLRRDTQGTVLPADGPDLASGHDLAPSGDEETCTEEVLFTMLYPESGHER